MVFFEIAILLFLTLCNGVFAMSELAIVSSRTARLRQMASAGGGGAQVALQLINDPGRFLSTVQIGITVVGLVAGAFGGATLGERFGRWLDGIPLLAGYGQILGVGTVIFGITYVSIVVGELIPKRIALGNPERIAALIAKPMRFLSKVAAPLVWLLGTSTNLVLGLLGLRGEKQPNITEEEVRALISEGTRAGVFVPEEKELIDGVLRLADRKVRSIMTPRPDVAWLDVTSDRDSLLEKIRSGHHSRYPVCRGNLDEVIGIIDTRHLLKAVASGELPELASHVAEPVVIHDGTSTLRFLGLMKKTGLHMMIVVDEYGSVEGVVTLTDIVEAIAGAFPEEGGEAEPAAIRRDDGSWLVEGWMPVDELYDLLDIRPLTAQVEFHTVAGLALHILGHLPVVGETFVIGPYRCEVVDLDGRRIDKILIVQSEQDVDRKVPGKA